MKYKNKIAVVIITILCLCASGFCQTPKNKEVIKTMLNNIDTLGISFQSSYSLSFKSNKEDMSREQKNYIYKGNKKFNLQGILKHWINHLNENNKVILEVFASELKLINNLTINKIDTNNLPKSNIKNNLNIYLSISLDSSIYLFADTANSDDINTCKKIYLGNLQNRKISAKNITLTFNNIELWNGSIVYKKNIKTKIEVNEYNFTNDYSDFIRKVENGDLISLISTANKCGEITLGNKKYYILLQYGITENLYDYAEKSFQFFSVEKGVTEKEYFINLKNGLRYQNNDTILLNNKFYFIGNLDTFCRWIEIKELNQKIIIGTRQGFYLPNFTAKHFGNDTSIQKLNFKNNSLKLLDFWGTWCTPCIKQMPKLSKFLQQHKEVNYYSILYDKKNNIDKAVDILHQNNLPLKNAFFDDRGKIFEPNNVSIINNLKIGCYPGFLLINGNGKILYKGCGEEALTEINKILESYPK